VEFEAMASPLQPEQRPLLLLGAGTTLHQSFAAWSQARPDRRIEVAEIHSSDNFNYDVSSIESYDRDHWLAFAALSNEAINFPRLKLMTDLRLLGWKFDRFISPRAMVPIDWSLGENGFIADGAVIGINCTLKHNCWIGPRAIIGPNVKLGHSVWVGPGAIVGEGVVVGDNTSIGTGAIVADAVTIGRQCELLIAQEYRAPVPDRTFFSPLFSEPVRIYGRPQRAANATGS
jgi:hypothetical protein